MNWKILYFGLLTVPSVLATQASLDISIEIKKLDKQISKTFFISEYESIDFDQDDITVLINVIPVETAVSLYETNSGDFAFELDIYDEDSLICETVFCVNWKEKNILRLSEADTTIKPSEDLIIEIIATKID